MLTLLTIFSSSFVLALSGALMPGPLLTVTISESSRRGMVAGPLLIIGHGILELALVIALMTGLAPFLNRDGVFIAVALLGAIILAWMAIGMFRALPTLSLSWQADGKAGSHLIITGVLMSIANPYWTIWWASIGLGYIIYAMQFGYWAVFFFFLGHILADLAWYAAVSAAISKGRHLMTDRLYRGLIGACASFLVVFACYFAYAGIQRLMI